MSDVKEFVVCENPDVLNGNRYCFCCFPNCIYRRIVSKNEIAINEYECEVIKENTNEKAEE